MSDERPILVRYGPPQAPARTASSADIPTLRMPAVARQRRAAETAAEGARVAWRPLIRQALRLWLWTRLLLVILTLATAALAYVRGHHAVASPAGLLDLWYRWDTTAYLHIVEQGYASVYSVAFFPLYPLLIGGPAHLFGLRSDLLFGLLISNLATLAAFIGLLRLAVDEGSDERAARAAGLLYLTLDSPFVISASQHYAVYLSASRYMLPAIPVYLALGRWE